MSSPFRVPFSESFEPLATATNRLYKMHGTAYPRTVSITAILIPDADGTVHVPLPPEWQHSTVKVTATVEVVPPPIRPQYGRFAGKIEMAPDFDAPLEDFREYTE